MTTTFAGLMCHAPIVIPAVAGPEASRCRATTRAMREVADRAVHSRPDRLVLISPHSPRHPSRFAAWPGPRHVGDLGDFRNPQIRVDLPDAPEVAQALDLPPVISPRKDWLDHGAMVPLSFLWDAGWRGPTAILALPGHYHPDSAGLGRALAALPGRTAVIASGDMSHRLIPGAPSGYHPDARRFDEAFVAALRRNDWPRALAAEPRELAAEDVIDSTAVAMAAAGRPLHAEVLSYEGPWGVGYTEAVFYDPEPPTYVIARRSVRAAALGKHVEPPAGGPPSQGVFVTLYRHGQLRGCIGHIQPRHARLWEELTEVARAAALEDPRFPPLTARELDDLQVEVSLLEPPEPVAGPEQLDPRRYGVIVRSGWRVGVLLPDLDGVDTVEQQIAIAKRKAGIRPDEPVELERFTVRKEVQP
ncbi:MAG: AmmeMemoRadiSam system protein A [Deltaproteobacteria bacterium]|nr:MAG: AmmeMemoRadiSam system protein A [Deltaproteobacteria bacterium]